jgi:hypothetical protein
MDQALLVGINRYPAQPLQGCINDIDDVHRCLVERFGFSSDFIRRLPDESATRAAIVEQLQQIVVLLSAGDRVCFYYSGHGARVPAISATGIAQVEEVICPVDFCWSGEDPVNALFTEDFARIFAFVPDGAEFVWGLDSCYAGGVWRDSGATDWASRCKAQEAPPVAALKIEQILERNGDVSRVSVAAKPMSNVGLIAACADNERAMDTHFGAAGRANGAFTRFFIDRLNVSTSGSLKTLATELMAPLTMYNQTPQARGDSRIVTRDILALEVLT